MNEDEVQNNDLTGDDIEARLWDYIDGVSNESATIKNLVEAHTNWQTKYAELLAVHQLIAASELDQPSLRFTKNVMDEIARYQISPATKKYINTKIIWGIAAFFITLIAGFLVYGFSQINWSADKASTPFGVNLSGVDYSKMFNNNFVNAFMMVNILLGLLLLERYLSFKTKKFRETH